jgi:hypothetical protein
MYATCQAHPIIAGNAIPYKSYGVLPIEQLNFPEDLNIPSFLVSAS